MGEAALRIRPAELRVEKEDNSHFQISQYSIIWDIHCYDLSQIPNYHSFSLKINL